MKQEFQIFFFFFESDVCFFNDFIVKENSKNVPFLSTMNMQFTAFDLTNKSPNLSRHFAPEHSYPKATNADYHANKALSNPKTWLLQKCTTICLTFFPSTFWEKNQHEILDLIDLLSFEVKHSDCKYKYFLFQKFNCGSRHIILECHVEVFDMFLLEIFDVVTLCIWIIFTVSIIQQKKTYILLS